MDSLEWRLKKLEDKVIGSSDIDYKESILSQLEKISAECHNQVNYKFIELYRKCGDISDVNDISKADLVLAYKDSLMRYMQDVKNVVEKSDKVLVEERWPDVSVHQEIIDKLQSVTMEQQRQAKKLDNKVEELIGIYNDILGSLKSNISSWNETLEQTELELDNDPRRDEFVD